MSPRFGAMVYWTASALAGLIVFLAIINYINSAVDGEPVFQVAALGFAGLIWFVGYACRRLIAGM